MVRMQIQLTEAQRRALSEMARREQVSMSALIRRALGSLLEGGTNDSDRRAIRDRALAVIGRFEGGGSGVAGNHDAHLAEGFAR